MSIVTLLSIPKVESNCAKAKVLDQSVKVDGMGVDVVRGPIVIELALAMPEKANAAARAIRILACVVTPGIRADWLILLQLW